MTMVANKLLGVPRSPGSVRCKWRAASTWRTTEIAGALSPGTVGVITAGRASSGRDPRAPARDKPRGELYPAENIRGACRNARFHGRSCASTGVQTGGRRVRQYGTASGLRIADGFWRRFKPGSPIKHSGTTTGGDGKMSMLSFVMTTSYYFCRQLFINGSSWSWIFPRA